MVDATKAYGADVVLCGEVFDESAAHAQELSDTEGMIYVPPFDDYEVLCGQGTIGLEILEDVPNVTDVVVPLGGGGLGAGVALAIKTFKPEVRVIGAIPEGSRHGRIRWPPVASSQPTRCAPPPKALP